jgi:hypothetical protein
MVSLRRENELAPATAPGMAPTPGPVEKGTVNLTSEPTGALVYINDILRGNTPFTYEGNAGIVKLKLELEGFHPLEKPVTVEGHKTLTVNFKLMSTASALEEQAKAKAVETSPIQIQDEKTKEVKPAQPEKELIPPIDEGFKDKK